MNNYVNSFARTKVMELAPYVPGKPIEEVQAEYGLTKVHKIASNENPFGVSPKAAEAIHAEIIKCATYPESSSPLLRKALAQRIGVKTDQIFVASGGDHIITLLGNAFINQDDQVIAGTPSFYTYTLSTVLAGGDLISVPLKNYTYDLNAILASVTEKTKLIFLCNPNNPTGTFVDRNKVADFMKRVPQRCIVVFDEAYFEFVDDPLYPNGIEEYVKTGANVVVLRTFSKIYGLAGLRIGYAVLSEHLAPVFGRVMPPFPVNRLAQAAALAALDDEVFMDKVLKNNNKERAYLMNEFARLGMDAVPSQTNFIYVDTHLPSQELYEKLLHRGIIIRPGSQWGAKHATCLRVSIGLPEDNQAFIQALSEILKD